MVILLSTPSTFCVHLSLALWPLRPTPVLHFYPALSSGSDSPRCLIRQAGVSPPSLTTGACHLYILNVRPFWPPGGPALCANVAGRIESVQLRRHFQPVFRFILYDRPFHTYILTVRLDSFAPAHLLCSAFT